jgi:hypothetical protein
LKKSTRIIDQELLITDERSYRRRILENQDLRKLASFFQESTSQKRLKSSAYLRFDIGHGCDENWIRDRPMH